jgi:SAM-dependent methyltransferase
MRRLANTSELLDGPLDDATLRGNLRDLARVNRWLGGSELSWRAVRNVLRANPPPKALRILDVGTGAADIPVYLALQARRASRQVDIVATDIKAELVAIASETAAGVAEVTAREAERDLRNEEHASFDVVHASLLAHHLDPPEARSALAQMGRVTRSVVVINDLQRGWSWWTGAWLLSHLLSANRYTRHDAALSVRRAYTADELSALARSVGLREVARSWSRPAYRYVLTFVRQPHKDA